MNNILPKVVNIPDDIDLLYNYYRAYIAIFDEEISILKIGYNKFCGEDFFLVYLEGNKNVKINVKPIYVPSVDETISEASHNLDSDDINCILDFAKSNLSFRFCQEILENKHIKKIMIIQ